MLEDYEKLIGKCLMDNLYDTKGTLLISKDTILLELHIKMLASFKVHPDSIRVAEANPKDSKFVSMSPEQKASRTKNYLYEINNLVQHEDIVPIADIESKVLPYIEETAKRYNLFRVFSELKDQGDFRYKQSLGVAILATSLGTSLGLNEKDLALLATAATLCDIGSVKLPSYLLHKPSRLDVHEHAIVEQHTILGYELLKNSGADHQIAIVALQHHEREDGSGYPNGLEGSQISRFSKIVALADIFVAMTSERPYRPALSFFEAVNEIHRQIILNRFDSVIGFRFLDILLTRQVGCNVLLSDGRKGKILFSDVNYPTKPLILLDNQEFIDLKKSDSVTISKVLG